MPKDGPPAPMIASNLQLAESVAESYFLANLTGKTVVQGASASGTYGLWEGLGVGGGVSVGIGVDASGNIGLVLSGRVGGGFKGSARSGYAAGESATFSPSKTIFGLQGSSPQGSLSGGGAGIGGSIGASPSGAITVTAGAASGVFGTFGGVGDTVEIPLVCVKP